MNEADHNEEIIFSNALKLSESEREGYLKKACRGDKRLQQRIEKLLEANAKSEGYLESAGDGGFAIAKAIQQSAPCDESPGDVIGRYKLLEKIGEGGWGVVWMAEQKRPVNRRVALKILKLGMDTKEVVARFESERQALAMMDHPNIAKVFDGGAAPSGRPYFVMELVRGVKITEYCDQEKLSPKDRLELFISICQAVQHAHQKGVIHRDIKPSNILVTVNDGEAVPKVIDFGIAKAVQFKLTDKTLFTRFHSFVGTPVYTSPEQMQMSSIDVDTRSDIYSLGVLLYELLSGKQPFNATRLSEMGIDAMRRVISEEDPPKPSDRVTSLNQEDRTIFASKRSLDPDRFPKELVGELDWIVMKCLEKNRTRRYETVNALAMDIRRFLNNEPITAREPTRMYRLKKLIDRNRLAFGVSVALAACLVIGSVTIALIGLHAIRSEKIAQLEARKSAEISEFMKSMYSHVDSQVELQIKGKASTQLLKETLKETLDLANPRIERVSLAAQIELYDILGSVYFKIREYASAERMFRRELEKLRSLNEPEHATRVQAINHLGAALGRQGKLQEAERSIEEALLLQREFLSDENLEVARTLVNLSVVQVKKAAVSDLTNEDREQNLQKAVSSIESALKIQRERLGNEHEEIAASLNELGFILACRGGENLIRAESVLREALAMNRKLLGDVTPAVASSINLLAIAQVMQGKYNEALAYYQRVRTIRKSLEETTARELFSSYDVSVWEHQNTGEESLQALHDVIAVTIQRFEPESLEIAGFLAIEAWAYAEEGRYVEAERIARKCLAIREKGDPDPWTPYHTQSLIGRALLGQGRIEEAEQLLVEGFNGVMSNRHLLTSEHELRLLECLRYLIELYTSGGRADDLQKLLAQVQAEGIELPEN